MPFAVSLATADITPPSGLPMGGYGTATSPRIATGANSRLAARCLIIWDDHHPRAIVSLDVLGLPRPIHQDIRARILATTTGTWTTADLALVSTHTHNGPALPGASLDPAIAYGMTDTTAIDDYADVLVNRVVAMVRGALAATRTPCVLEYQVTDHAWAANREGLSYRETAVPVLVAKAPDGRPLAILASYGCHPVSAGAQTRWDGDWPGVARSAIAASIPGCFAMVIPGPVGDQDPGGDRGWASSTTGGTQLGDTIVRAAKAQGRPLSGPVVTAYREVGLPLDITLTAANLATVRACYLARSASASAQAWERRHATAMIAKIDNHDTIPTTVPVPIQTWRTGGSLPLRICMTGGELVSGYAAYLRARYNGTGGIMIATCAGEVPAYIPSNELLPPARSGGSYAGGWGADYPGIAGGAMTVYPHIGHFKAGTGGAERILIAALTEQLD